MNVTPTENRTEAPRVERPKSREVSLAEAFGWDNDTMTQERIGDVELFITSGHNTEFVLQHQRLRNVLEASEYFKDTGPKGVKGARIRGMEQAEIMAKLEAGQPLEVEMTGKDTGKKIDLRVLARFFAMKTLNEYMGAYGFTEEELERKFFNFENIEVIIPKEDGSEEKVDFWKECPVDNMSDWAVRDPNNKDEWNINKYLDKVRDNQMGLQWMGSLRDECMAGKHVENSGHALFKETHKMKASTGLPEALYLPSCYTSGVNYSRGDMQKVDNSVKAGGHIHEFCHYNEEFAVAVKFDALLINKHRAGLDFRSWSRTLPRTYKGEIGVEQNETLEATKEEVDEEMLSCVWIGGKNREGRIYKGLHSTYDLGMKKRRGFELTDEEADDLIFTDVVAQAIANNTTDWAMSLSNTYTGQISYEGATAYQKGAEDWKKFGFCVKIRCKLLDKEGNLVDKEGKVLGKDEKPVIDVMTFTNYNDLIDYVNKRIKMGDLDGVSTTRKVNHYKGADPKAVADALGEPQPDESKEEKEINTLINTAVPIFKKVLGAQAEKVLGDYIGEGNAAKMEVEDDKGKKKTCTFLEFILGKEKKPSEWTAQIDVQMPDVVTLMEKIGVMLVPPKKGKENKEQKETREKNDEFRKQMRQKLFDDFKNS